MYPLANESEIEFVTDAAMDLVSNFSVFRNFGEARMTEWLALRGALIFSEEIGSRINFQNNKNLDT